MLAVVNFPKYEADEPMENLESLVDDVFDFLDEKVDEGSDPTDVLAAMLIVIKLISDSDGNVEAVH